MERVYKVVKQRKSQIKVDFKEKIDLKYEINRCNNMIKEEENDHACACCTMDRSRVYVKNEGKVETDDNEWRGSLIGNQGEKCTKVIWREENNDQNIENDNAEEEYDANEQILRKCMQERRAHTACNRSQKLWQHSRHFVISCDQNANIIEGTIESNEWDLNNIKTTKGHILLELVEKISQSCDNLESGHVMVHLDNKNLFKNMITEKKKASQCAVDCGTMLSRIDHVLKKMTAEIGFEHSSAKKNNQ